MKRLGRSQPQSQIHHRRHGATWPRPRNPASQLVLGSEKLNPPRKTTQITIARSAQHGDGVACDPEREGHFALIDVRDHRALQLDGRQSVAMLGRHIEIRGLSAAQLGRTKKQLADQKEFGLGEESREHDGVLKVLWLPFVKAGRLLRHDLQVTPPAEAEASQRAAPAS